MADADRIRPLTRAELDTALDWAADEGWNPGLADADAFWDADPDGFLGVERDGELIGSGSIVSYGGEFGFMGLFIVRPDLRGQGIGRRLWKHRRDLLVDRLRPGAAIGLDGVFEMESFYAAGGFVLSHRTTRFKGMGADSGADPDLVPLPDLPFEQVAEFDREHFGFAREAFLSRWIHPAAGLGLALPGPSGLRAMGVIRPCREGFKIGPLFASDAEAAERVLHGLRRAAVGEPYLLDVPEPNSAAMEIAERHGMEEVFGCARMYLGPVPDLPWARIYGTTSFELG